MRSRRVVLWAGFSALLCIVIACVVAVKARSVFDVAGVVGLLVSIGGLVISLVQLSWSRENRLGHEADRLARVVEEQADLARASAVNDGGPADIAFSAVGGLTRGSDGGPSDGSVATLASCREMLDRGRLVILGDLGAGKSVLLVLFALEQLRNQPDIDRRPRMVPVRMRLASFDPFRDGSTADRLGDVGLVTRFEEWMAREVMQLGFSRKAATQLVAERRVLPLLDGLDETGEPRRAVAVLRALNVRADSRPFLLTSRTDWFRQVAEEERLSNASVVELKPLSSAAVRDYLLGRPGIHATESRWRKTLDSLDSLESAAGYGVRWPDPFAEALRSPWRLYLCTTVFAEKGDPYEELAELAPDEMTGRLLSSLIPALVAQDTRTRGSRWQPAQMTRWLRGMARSDVRLRFDSADISLATVWSAAGKTLPRLLGALAQAVLGWGLGAVAFVLEFPVVLHISFPPGEAAALAAGGMLFMLAVAVMNTGMPVMVSELSLHLWRTKNGLRTLLTVVAPWSLAGGAAWAGVVAAVFSPPAALPSGGVVSGLLFLLLSMGRRPSAVVRPSQMIRRSIAFDLVAASLCGTAFALMAGFSGVPVLPAGILGFFVLARPTWFRYVAAVVLARRGNRLPWRPARVLDWAYDAGLVRLSGSGVEFRHPELRSWLTGPEEPPTPLRVRSDEAAAGERGERR